MNRGTSRSEIATGARVRTASTACDADAQNCTVRRGYQAFGEGDMEHFRGIYTPDVVQRQPGNNQTSGEHQAVDNVLAL